MNVSTDIQNLPHRAYGAMDFVICSLGLASFAGFITEATPYFVFFSALFSCILFGIRVFVAIRDFGKKTSDPNSNESIRDDYSQKDLQ